MSFFTSFKPDFFTEKSLLTSHKLVEWKRKNNAYNFTKVPDIAIISPVNILSFSEKIFKKRLKGLSGNNYVLNRQVLFSSGFGVGAPAIIALLEELVALGVKKFLFVGFSGRLNESIKEGEAFMVTEAFSLCGTSYFYEKESFVSCPTSFSSTLKNAFNLSEKICLTTDAPFKEASSIISFYKKKEAVLIDMETAAILAFCKQNKTEVACVLIASDLIDAEWTPPKNQELLHKKAKNIVNQFITSL